MSDLGKELIEALKEAKEEGLVELFPSNRIASIRKKLHLTQREFSETYHIQIDTLRKWEQGKRFPDSTSIAYLSCIDKAPEIIRNILNDQGY